MQEKIGNKILILGGGRWGQITYNNLFNTNFTHDIQIISKFLNLSKSILKNKNVRIKRKINYSKIKNYNLIIICKNNISKIKYLKKLKDFSNILVIEKPLIIKNNIKKFLLFFSKKKFFISLPWYFEFNLKKIIKNFINSSNVNHIKFIWFDDNKKKYGLSKNYDKNICYSEDIFSHIYSIIHDDKSKPSNLKFSSFKIKNNIEYVIINYKKIKIEIHCSNQINKNLRKIVFNNNKKIIGQIKISDRYFHINDKIKKIHTKLNKRLNNLTTQYKYLLNEKKIKKFKNLCIQQILYQNQLHILCKNYKNK